MTLIDKYIAKNVLASIMLVTVTLLGLNAFILFIDQIGDLGRGNYGAFQAMLVVLLGMPYQIYLFFPVASLLGALIGLGLLANHRELIVMRAAGMSISNITGSVFKMAIPLILIVTVMGEWGVPYFSQWARDVKTQAISEGKIARTASGIWLRYQQDFLRLGQIISGNNIENIVQFHFNSAHQLVFARTIQHAYFQKGQWFVDNIQETHFQEDKTSVIKTKFKPWEVKLNPPPITPSRL